jgi:hypothetical protein
MWVIWLQNQSKQIIINQNEGTRKLMAAKKKRGRTLINELLGEKTSSVVYLQLLLYTIDPTLQSHLIQAANHGGYEFTWIDISNARPSTCQDTEKLYEI